MNKITLLIFLIFGIVIPAKGFNLSPTEFEQRIDNNGYREYHISNTDLLNTLRYRVTALEGWEGVPSMHHWVTVSPEVLIVKPGERGMIKVFSNAPKDSEIGEYSFYLNFRSIPAPKMPGEVTGENIGAQAMLGMNINMGMIGYLGDLPSKLKVEDYSFSENKEGKTVMTLGIKSDTEKRAVNYNIEIIDKKGGVLSIDAGRIRADEKVTHPITLERLKKNDIAMVRLKGKESYEEIFSVKIN